MALANINVIIGARINRLVSELGRAENQLRRSARRMSSIGDSLTRNVSLPIIGAGVAAAKFAIDFETSFKKLDTLVGISGDQLRNFESGIKRLSGPLGQSRKELSEALFVVTSAGQRGAAALEILEQSGKAAALGLGSTKEVSKAATAVLNTFGAETISAARSVDVLTSIVREGNLEAEELAPSLGRVLPVLKNLNVSFEEGGAAIAEYSKLGISASESVTALRSLLNSIQKPADGAAKELKGVGLSTEILRDTVKKEGLVAAIRLLNSAFKDNEEALSRIIGKQEGFGLFLALSQNNAEGLEKTLINIRDNTSDVNREFAKVSETTGQKFKVALVNLQNAGIEFGAAIIPTVSKVITALNKMAAGLSNLSPATKSAAVGVGIFVAAIGPAFSAVGMLQRNMASLAGVAGTVVKGLGATVDILSRTTRAFFFSGNIVQGFSAALKTAAVAFRALDTTMKLSVIGIVAAGVAAAVLVFKAFTKSVKSAEDVTKSLAVEQARLGVQVDEEKKKVNQLITAIGDETISKAGKQKAIEKLQELYPSYLQGIDLEGAKTAQLTKIQLGLNQAIEQGIIERRRAAKVGGLQDEAVDIKIRIAELEAGDLTKIGERAKAGFKAFATGTEEAFKTAVIENYKAELESVNAELEQTDKFYEKLLRPFDVSVTADTAEAKRGVDEFKSTFPETVEIRADVKTGQTELDFDPVKIESEIEPPVPLGPLTAPAIMIDSEIVPPEPLDPVKLDVDTPDPEKIERINDIITDYNTTLKSITEGAKVFGSQSEVIDESIAATETAIKSLLGEGLTAASPAVRKLTADYKDLARQSRGTNIGVVETLEAVNLLPPAIDAIPERKTSVINVTLDVPVSKFAELQDKLLEINNLEIALPDFDATGARINAITEGVGMLSKNLQENAPIIAGLNEQLNVLTNTERWERLNEAISNIVNDGLANAIAGAAEFFGTLAGGGGLNFGALLGPLLNALEQLGKLAISTGVAMLALQTTLKNPFSSPFGAIAAGAGLLALVKIAKSRLAKIGGSISLAEGGIVSRPVQAIVGDNPRSPEVVAPLHKLQAMIGGGTINLAGAFRLSGSDLVLAVERATRDRQRTRGR